jgi:hypothetical protein
MALLSYRTRSHIFIRKVECGSLKMTANSLMFLLEVRSISLPLESGQSCDYLINRITK